MFRSISLAHFLCCFSLAIDDTRNLERLKDLLESVVDGATQKRIYGKEVTWNLPVDQSSNFAGIDGALKQKATLLWSYMYM